MPSITLILFIDAVHFVFARYRRLRVMAANDEPPGGSATQHGLPRRREPDLSGLATFGLSPQGQVISWSLTATALFGYQAQAVIGRDVCDVLMTGPGHRKLVGHALAEAAAGRVLTATVAGGSLGEGRFAIRWEPMTGPGDTVLVIVQSAWPQPKPGWLSEAEARIGSSLDLTRTASEVAAAAVPRLADAAVIYAAERLLAADDPAPPSLAARSSSSTRTRHARGRWRPASRSCPPSWTARRPSGSPAATAACGSPPAMPPSWPCRSSRTAPSSAARCLGALPPARRSAPVTSPWPVSWPPAPRSASTTPGCMTGNGAQHARCSEACCPAGRRSPQNWISRPSTSPSETTLSAATGMTSSRYPAAGQR